MYFKKADLAEGVKLSPHQQRVAKNILKNPRMLLYHGLGSGKTLSAIAAGEAAGGDYGAVTPASLRDNFYKEVGKFTEGINPEVLSYSGLALGKNFKKIPDTLIFDEVQRIRNPNSASTMAAQALANKAKNVVLLSGTPIVNHPSDLVVPISMLTNNPMDTEEFNRKFIDRKKVYPGIIPWLMGAKPGEVLAMKNEQAFRNLLKNKVDYHPSKAPEGVNVNEETIFTKLTPEQLKLQDAIKNKISMGSLWKLDNEFPLSGPELSNLNSFLTGLRQVGLSTNTFRDDGNALKAFEQSGKLTTALGNLKRVLDDKRKKAIIYSNFIDAGIEPYAAALKRDKIPYGVFHGGISEKLRRQMLNDYNEGKLRALLIGPAGAEGISTKGTSLIQLLDPHWNDARGKQAQGRGLRFDSHEGLSEDLKNVIIQKYINQADDPSFWGKLVGSKKQKTGDEILESLSAQKEQINEEFRKVLRDIGAKK